MNRFPLETPTEPEWTDQDEAAYVAALCPERVRVMRSATTGGELLALVTAHESGCVRCCPKRHELLRSAQNAAEINRLMMAHNLTCVRCGSARKTVVSVPAHVGREPRSYGIAVIGNGLYVRTATPKKRRRA